MRFTKEIRPDQLTASVDNYDFDLLCEATHVMLRSYSPLSITGVLAGDYRMKGKIWYNTTAFAITLPHQHTDSEPDNQWFSTTGEDVVLAANGGWIYSYLDTTAGYWRI